MFGAPARTSSVQSGAPPSRTSSTRPSAGVGTRSTETCLGMVDQQRRSAAVDAAWYAMPAICTRMPAVLLLELLYAAWLAAHVAAALAAELMISCVTISGSR